MYVVWVRVLFPVQIEQLSAPPLARRPLIISSLSHVFCGFFWFVSLFSDVVFFLFLWPLLLARGQSSRQDDGK